MKKNLPDWESYLGLSDPQLSTYPLSYRAIDIINVEIDICISPHTFDQYWSALDFYTLTQAFISLLLCRIPWLCFKI